MVFQVALKTVSKSRILTRGQSRGCTSTSKNRVEFEGPFECLLFSLYGLFFPHTSSHFTAIFWNSHRAILFPILFFKNLFSEIVQQRPFCHLNVFFFLSLCSFPFYSYFLKKYLTEQRFFLLFFKNRFFKLKNFNFRYHISAYCLPESDIFGV